MEERREVRASQEKPAPERRPGPCVPGRRLPDEQREGDEGDERRDQEVEGRKGEEEEDGGEEGKEPLALPGQEAPGEEGRPDRVAGGRGYSSTSSPRSAERYAASISVMSCTCSRGGGASASPEAIRTKWSSCRR